MTHDELVALVRKQSERIERLERVVTFLATRIECVAGRVSVRPVYSAFDSQLLQAIADDIASMNPEPGNK